MAPLTPETKYAICAKNLALAKEGLRIVNTARGELIENAALIEALNSGKVAAAGLDVLENEPLTDTEHQLMSFDNVTLTPHTAYQTVESIEILKVKGINTAIDFLQGKKPYHVVNPAVLTKT
jgi:D-3-phosphoglycerate dehydrogenase